ncbi:MAG: urocanate hydratase [Euryarchaeota archaeon]|nr:urocanate hydratase [Euryarchaeota archaeon]
MSSIRAPRGRRLTARGWRQEGILRMLMNNLENAERPDDLIIYGGTGRAARSWKDYRRIVSALETLGANETLIVQSGRAQAVFRTHSHAPRVLIANSNLVPRWSTWDHFNALERKGLMMYGQMTAGSWCYIGSQGIIQGTYETLAAVARRHFRGTLNGRIVLTGGLGGMGGAQPPAVKMNGGVSITVEVDERRIKRRMDNGFCDVMATEPKEALALAKAAASEKRALSIALLGNCAETHGALHGLGFRPDIVTDQTSAHDPLNGYVPAGSSVREAEELRREDPRKYVERSMTSMRDHCKAIVAFMGAGSVAFDYGNNLRAQAKEAGFADAFAYPGFVSEYIRPLFCEGRGPFRWIALTGEGEDIHETGRMVKKLFPKDKGLRRWIDLADANLPWEGLPARVCWLGFGERHRFALKVNQAVASGRLGPVAMTRDHLDSGSVASPYRETESMLDGSDAVADWPILNALLNTAAGADLVAVHNGGGVGIGLSTHAGMIVVADGTKETSERIRSVYVADPGMGIVRHADAGYKTAKRILKRAGPRLGLRSPK